MKTTKVFSVLALSTVALFTSCKKNELTPAGGSANTQAKLASGNSVMAPTYDEGIRSVTSLATGTNAAIGYIAYNTSYVKQSPGRFFDLSGDAIGATSAKCYGAAAGIEAIVYNGTDGFARISVATGLNNTSGVSGTSFGGAGTPVLIGGNVTSLIFEEIEINPADGQAYGIVRNGNAIQLYRIATDGSGTATVITYNGNAEIFHNPIGNGYKSGSICFVETPANSGVYELAYANESTVYATLGIVVWRYSVVGNTVVVNSAHNATYVPSLIPGAQTGKINTASIRGQLFFARDNSPMFQLNGTNSVTPVAITPVNAANSNDFGYYKAF